MPDGVARVEPVIWLEVEGTTYPAVGVSLNFALNKIPTGSCSLPLGRDVSSLREGLTGAIGENFRAFRAAKVWCRMKGEMSPGGKRWPEEPQVIFDGYLTGFGYQKVSGGVRAVVHLTHWLSDLAFSSTLSNQSHPANPIMMRWVAVYGSEGRQVEARTAFIGDHVGQNLFTPISIAEDFWGQSLFPFFQALGRQDILDNIGPDSCIGLNGQNLQTQAALRRLESRLSETNEEVSDNDEEGASSRYYKPLSIDIGSVGRILAEGIGTYCRTMTLDSYFQTTLWDTLVGRLGPEFRFVLVPKILTSQIVPFVPGLRRTYDEEFGGGEFGTIDIRDTLMLNSTFYVPRPVRAVGVLQANAIGQSDAFDRSPVQELGGCFAPDPDAAGMVLFKRLPDWMNAMPYHANNMRNTALPDAPGTATTPVAPGIALGDEDGETFLSTMNQMRDYYDSAARAIMAEEMIRGRFEIAQTKLRFDLAPGANVRLVHNTPLSPLQAAQDQLNGRNRQTGSALRGELTDMVATVTRVTIAIDAEARTAGTGFQLEHVRTLEENERDGTSVAEHPFYESTFTGAPLLGAYAELPFEPTPEGLA